MRSRHLALAISLIACGGGEGFAPCPPLENEESWPPLAALDAAAEGVSRPNLNAWVGFLTSPRLAGRRAGEPGAKVVAARLDRQLAELGLALPASAGGSCQARVFGGLEVRNVIGHLPGPPAGDAPILLVSAHHDGLGRHPTGGPYPGADDNASGVAALLEIARLAALRRPPGVEWVFAAFGGEEIGQLGSRGYLGQPTADLGRVALAVNLDMVGRSPAGDTPTALRYLAPRELRGAAELLASASKNSGVTVRPLDSFAGDSTTDAHILARRVPSVLLTTGLHADHHRLSDTPDRLDYAEIERAVRWVLALGDALSAASPH